EYGAPLWLAEALRFEALVELHPSGSGGTAEKGPKGLGIEFFHEMWRIVSRLTICLLTKAFAGACQPRSARGWNRKKNRLVLAVIDDAQDQLGPARRPVPRRLRFGFALALHQEKFRIGRQLLDRADIANRCVHIEQIRLVFRIDGVERDARGDDGIDLSCVLANLFVFAQMWDDNQAVS